MLVSLGNCYNAFIRTVKTASDIVPMINAFELRCLSMNGGFEPCCVKDNSQSGRAMKSRLPVHSTSELSLRDLLEQSNGSMAIHCRGDGICMMFDASFHDDERKICQEGSRIRISRGVEPRRAEAHGGPTTVTRRLELVGGRHGGH